MKESLITHVANMYGKTNEKENERYRIEDIGLLDNLTVSKTVLKPEQETRGHKHSDIDEVYIFIRGAGMIQLGEDVYQGVSEGSLILIPGGTFHRVNNPSMIYDLEFICIFEKYRRDI